MGAGETIWLESKLNSKWFPVHWLKWLPVLLVGSGILMMELYIGVPLGLIFAMLPMVVSAYFLTDFLIPVAEFELGIKENSLALRKNAAILVEMPFDKIEYYSHILIIGKYAIPLGQSQQPMYEWTAIKNHLLPKLDKSKKLTYIESRKKLLAMGCSLIYGEIALYVFSFLFLFIWIMNPDFLS